MKHKFLTTAVLLVVLSAGTAAWAGQPADRTEFLEVKCYNGIFVGGQTPETGVVAFKGIPYAKQPVGKLRWQAPRPPEYSAKRFWAQEYGNMPLQNLVSYNVGLTDKLQVGEDCLNLNVWTADLKTKQKPVMVYIHGGGYGWEAASFPIYDLQYLVKDNPDIVAVSIDYRQNSLGFLDLSKVPDGKVYKSKDFRDAPYLGVLDTVAALKWVKENIAEFGGDPTNVTIFGESAGGGLVSAMLVNKDAKGLFRRAIVQSGACNLFMAQPMLDRVNQTEALLRATGAKNMDDLMALKPETIMEAWKMPADRAGVSGLRSVENLNHYPLRGGDSPIPDDPLAALAEGAAKNVDLMIGTVADEWLYWIPLMGQPTMAENVRMLDRVTRAKEADFRQGRSFTKQALIDRYLRIARSRHDEWEEQYPGFWERMELVNDVMFRLPSIKMLEAHSQAKGLGRTYGYYFAKPGMLDGKYWGAFHSSELPYVFNNKGCEMYGGVNAKLAGKLSRLWTNFARTGDPTMRGVTWKEYDSRKRATLMIDAGGDIYTEYDPLSQQRQLLDEYGLYYLE